MGNLFLKPQVIMRRLWITQENDQTIMDLPVAASFHGEGKVDVASLEAKTKAFIRAYEKRPSGWQGKMVGC